MPPMNLHRRHRRAGRLPGLGGLHSLRADTLVHRVSSRWRFVLRFDFYGGRCIRFATQGSPIHAATGLDDADGAAVRVVYDCSGSSGTDGRWNVVRSADGIDDDGVATGDGSYDSVLAAGGSAVAYIVGDICDRGFSGSNF